MHIHSLCETRFSCVCTPCIYTRGNYTTSPACDSHTCANECFSGGRRHIARSCIRESWRRVALALRPFALAGRCWQPFVRSSAGFPSLEPLIPRRACGSGISLAGFRLWSSTFDLRVPAVRSGDRLPAHVDYATQITLSLYHRI